MTVCHLIFYRIESGIGMITVHSELPSCLLPGRKRCAILSSLNSFKLMIWLDWWKSVLFWP